MHPDFWYERWQGGQIGFHQSAVNPFLEQFWPRVEAAPGGRVYVPLCGKSLDMVWLADRGHGIVGTELSEIAIRDFFGERGLSVDSGQHGPFRRHAAAAYEILQGDALELTPELLGPVHACYDRAALIALPPAMRADYAQSMGRLMPPASRTLLITLEYPQEMKGGPPFSVEADEVRGLYEWNFEVELLARKDMIAENPKFAEAGIPALYESAWLLTRR